MGYETGAQAESSLTVMSSSESLYRPNPVCGTYLGINEDGLYEFEATIPADGNNQPRPLMPDHYYSRQVISTAMHSWMAAASRSDRPRVKKHGFPIANQLQ